MAEIRTRPVQGGDIGELAVTLRDEDRVEIMAMADPGARPRQILQEAVDESLRCWALELHGELAALLGLVPSQDPRVGVPWLLGSRAVGRHPRTHIRATRRYLAVMLDLRPCLFNYVHADYRTSVRWLSWMGFTLHAPQPLGVNGELFHPFTWGLDLDV